MLRLLPTFSRFAGLSLVLLTGVGGLRAAVPEKLFAKRDAQFAGAPLTMVVDDFRSRDKFNVIVKPSPTNATPIHVYVHDIPMHAVVAYVARAAGLNAEFKKFGAVLEPTATLPPQRTPQPVVSRVLLKKVDIDFDDTSVHDILQYCVQVHGLNLVYVNPAAWRERTVSLNLKSISLLQLLNYINELARVPVRMDKWAVVVGEQPKAPTKQDSPPDEQ